MRNSGMGGMGRNKTSGKEGSGPSGQCVCVKCNYTSPKKRGAPCMDEKCPHCGAVLLRKDGAHYKKAVNK